MARRKRLAAGVLFVAGGLSLISLTSCDTQVPQSAADLASEHPDSITAARYLSIEPSDLPSGFEANPVTEKTSALDQAQTLAEYHCEGISPPTSKALVTSSTPDYANRAGTTELHETTAIFPSAPAASAHLALEQNNRYPSCKADAFRESLIKSAPTGEHIGSVTVHVSTLPKNLGDEGLEVVGVCSLGLPGGESAVATANLVVLVRRETVVELSVDTDGPDPVGLVENLTADLARRLAHVLPDSSSPDQPDH
jgi:hypothetical protein